MIAVIWGSSDKSNRRWVAWTWMFLTCWRKTKCGKLTKSRGIVTFVMFSWPSRANLINGSRLSRGVAKNSKSDWIVDLKKSLLCLALSLLLYIPFNDLSLSSHPRHHGSTDSFKPLCNNPKPRPKCSQGCWTANTQGLCSDHLLFYIILILILIDRDWRGNDHCSPSNNRQWCYRYVRLLPIPHLFPLISISQCYASSLFCLAQKSRLYMLYHRNTKPSPPRSHPHSWIRPWRSQA